MNLQEVQSKCRTTRFINYDSRNSGTSSCTRSCTWSTRDRNTANWTNRTRPKFETQCRTIWCIKHSPRNKGTGNRTSSNTQSTWVRNSTGYNNATNCSKAHQAQEDQQTPAIQLHEHQRKNVGSSRTNSHERIDPSSATPAINSSTKQHVQVNCCSNSATTTTEPRRSTGAFRKIPWSNLQEPNSIRWSAPLIRTHAIRRLQLNQNFGWLTKPEMRSPKETNRGKQLLKIEKEWIDVWKKTSELVKERKQQSWKKRSRGK